MADISNDTATVLGPDANFKGELTFEKGMRLQGRFEGKITTPGKVVVSKEAKMQADVEAGAIVIEAVTSRSAPRLRRAATASRSRSRRRTVRRWTSRPRPTSRRRRRLNTRAG
jgi:hypothetical protein